jgi:hypothetical protein
MTAADLRAICDSLNDEHGTGGQTRLARMIGRSPRTIRNKLSGQSPITQSDELAIRQAVGTLHGIPDANPGKGGAAECQEGGNSARSHKRPNLFVEQLTLTAYYTRT